MRQAGLKIVTWIQSILVTIYVLEPVGAAAVTSLGWEACRILKLDWIRSAPLWFAGYVLVYNLDRLYPDPADPVNVPVRWRKTLELRSARLCLVLFCSLVLIIWPVLTGRWWLVLALGLAVVLLQFYSRPIPGTCHRIKDLPYIKSLSVPGLIAGALVLWPCLENGGPLRTKECFVFLWCLLVLTINGLVFDYRDIAGDAAFGTRTLPVQLGRRNTIYLLLASNDGDSWRERVVSRECIGESSNACRYDRRLRRLISSDPWPVPSDDDQHFCGSIFDAPCFGTVSSVSTPGSGLNPGRRTKH